MILLHKANKVSNEGETLRANIDHIIALQRQSPFDGNDFTAIILFGAPAFDAKETEEEIMVLINAARAARRTAGLN